MAKGTRMKNVPEIRACSLRIGKEAKAAIPKPQ
jgi:hypothetical protein